MTQGFFKLTSLRKIGLGDNELSNLSTDIGYLENLTDLDLSRNSTFNQLCEAQTHEFLFVFTMSIVIGVDELPEEIKKCRNLKFLDMTGNPLRALPNAFTSLTNLTHLTLNDVTLCDLPTDIGNLISLTQLEARDNYFSVVPVSIGRLSNLRLLDLGGNELSFLPDTIGNLVSLEEISLDANQLTQLPITIGRLKNLVALDVTDNRLYRLPDAIGGCSSMTDLIVTQNMLEVLPDSVGQLKNLRLLKVDQNRLIALTAAIGDCGYLRDLILSHNLLFQLPPSIGNLRHLQLLNVDNNQIEFLPPELGNCDSLRILSIQNNLIESIPHTLGKCSHLKILYFAGNKLESLPGSLRRCPLQAVWLTEAQSKPLMAFCEDEDIRTGKTVLRCCLLPQQQIACGSLENLTRSSFSTEDGSLRRRRHNFDNPIVTSTPATQSFNVTTSFHQHSHIEKHQQQPPQYQVGVNSSSFTVPSSMRQQPYVLNTTVTSGQQKEQQTRQHSDSAPGRTLLEVDTDTVMNSTYTVTQNRPRSNTDQPQNVAAAGYDSPVVIQSPTSLSSNEQLRPNVVQIERKFRKEDIDETGIRKVEETEVSKVS